MLVESSGDAGYDNGDVVEWVRGWEFGGGSEREVMGERDV